MNQLMLDIETMGTDNNAMIVSISAVQFNIETGNTAAEFEVGIDWKEQIDNGAKVDVETFKWWLKQEKDAQNSLFDIFQQSVHDALYLFNKWILDNFKDVKKVDLYGNGSTFDNVIVRNLYKRHNIEFVLPYWCDKDVRTLMAITNTNAKDFEFKGIKHNGLHDCRHQINYCSIAYNKINKE